MFVKLVLIALVAVAAAAPQGRYTSPSTQSYGGPVVPILKDEREGPDAYGNYKFEFETGDGIRRQEQGAPEGKEGAVASQGYWSFTFPDGTPGEVSFVANADGYQPQSNLLPVGPPLPPHAIAQIEFARQQAASGGSRPVGRYN